MRRKDVRRRLEAMGRSPGPAPRETFVDELGHRLRRGGPGRERAPAPFPARFTLVAATLTLLIVAGVAALLIDRDPTPGGVEVHAAHDAVVLLPDGESVEAREGLLVPDGSTVRTGPAGHLRADGSELGPDGEGVVSGGRLEVRDSREARDPRDTREPDPAPEATPRPTRAPERTPRPDLDTTQRPTPTPAPTEDLELACRSMVRDGRAVVACRWEASTDRAFAAYQLWRSDGAERLVVHRTSDRDATGFADMRVEPGQRYTYVVEALDAERRVIASGGPVQVTLDR